ncbi:4-hydroxybenzoate transporter PcaK [Dickeya solani]|nr:4-hydroxybenzoate transporter PcaK [Dickeya solani]
MSTHDISAGAIEQVVSTTHSESTSNAELVARLERMPITRQLLTIRVVVGLSTFFDAYTVLAIAFAMPQLAAEWGLSAADIGMIIAASYVGQLVGAVFFGSLAEKIGRLGVLKITILLFVFMDAACLFAWSGASMMVFRFLQGLVSVPKFPWRAPISTNSSVRKNAGASSCCMKSFSR